MDAEKKYMKYWRRVKEIESKPEKNKTMISTTKFIRAGQIITKQCDQNKYKKKGTRKIKICKNEMIHGTQLQVAQVSNNIR